MKKWNTTKLMATGSLGVILSSIMMLGAILASIIGIFAASAPIGIFFQSLFYALTPLVVPIFGSATLMGFVTGFLLIPAPAMGTPGFFGKVVIAILMGIASDVINKFIKNNKIAAMIAGGTSQIIIGSVLFGAAKAFGFPGIEKLPSFLSTPIGFSVAISITFILGAMGGLIGWKIYNKIKNTPIVKRIQKQ